MSFYRSRTGVPIDGNPQNAFLPEFKTIPDGTTAPAMIKSYVLVEKVNQLDGSEEAYYEVTYKIVDGEFKNREVRQKIKPFNGKPEAIDRALNMMELLYKLCDYRPSHDNAPLDADLLPMNGKIVGIKIGVWSVGGKDGNMVREIHKADASFVTKTGVAPVVKSGAPESALNRNKGAQYAPDDGIPFY